MDFSIDPNGDPVSFTWRTEPGGIEATPDVDYGAPSGSISLSPSHPSESVFIPVYQDDAVEEGEFFTVFVDTVDGEPVGDGGYANVAILDDDISLEFPDSVDTASFVL